MNPLGIEEIRAAAEVIAGPVIQTPLATSDELDAAVGATVIGKLEAAQRSGSFKFRGAYHRLSKLAADPDQAAKGVVAVSSGNHGAAVAVAAAMLRMPAVIYIPEDAPSAKRALIEAAGAEVITFERRIRDREAPARRRARNTGATFVHPFEDRDIMLGQGTVALELHEQAGPLDALLVPMSGGGLMAGCASAMAALDPGCRMIGVEPAVGDDNRRSFEAGRPVSIEQPDTIADGLAVTSPGAATFAINHRLVERVATVSEARIAEAMALVRDTLGWTVEPSGVVGIAALMDRPDDLAARRVGVVLSGGNIDRARFDALVGAT